MFQVWRGVMVRVVREVDQFGFTDKWCPKPKTQLDVELFRIDSKLAGVIYERAGAWEDIAT